MTDVVYGMSFSPTDAINLPTYSTNTNRLQSDLTNPAPLFNVRTIPAGTGSSIDFSITETISEQLLVVNHELGYLPQVYIVFYLIPKDPSVDPSTFSGAYTIGQMFLAEGGAGADFINYTVNTQTLTINHINESFGGSSGSYTSYAPDYNLWVKYIICNNSQIQTITIN